MDQELGKSGPPGEASPEALEAVPETFGQRLRRFRLDAGLSAGELALRIGTPSGRSLIDAWERDRSEPGMRWLVPLARALKRSLEELLTGEVQR